MFGKLIPIYQLHKRLQASLFELESQWNTETSQLGEVLLPHLDEMEKVNPYYLNSPSKASRSLFIVFVLYYW